MSVHPPSLTSEHLKLYETWYVRHGTSAQIRSVFFNPSQKPLCLCVHPLTLLGNGSVKMLPWQRTHGQQ